MRKKHGKIVNFIGILSVCLLTELLGPDVWRPMTAGASTIGEVQNQINEHTGQLNSANEKVVALETEQELLQEQIDDLNAEIVNTMTSIGMLEEQISAKEGEISAKEGEISAKEGEISAKEGEIRQTEAEYEAMAVKEESQRENMAICARLIYEREETSYLDVLLTGKSLGDILDQLDRAEKVYAYENAVLTDYIAVKNQMYELWERLVEEKAGLEADREQLASDREQLEADRDVLEADREELKGQKKNLDAMMAKKKRQSANYDAEIKEAKRAAEEAKRLLKQDQERLKQLQSAGSGKTPSGASATTDYTAVINGANGSALGKQIANFACQYIGNPYVAGGTSLTGGADCSGFTYRVYSEFGYSLPRTSYQQRSAGTGVSYEEAQPGDLVCYDGHVGLYIGGGLIVHASNSRPYPTGGIKVSQAKYRTILAVRRVVK